MRIDSIKFKGHRCFRNDFVGFDRVMPINILIGRNNSGKSHMIDFASAMCQDNPFVSEWECRFEGVLEEQDLRRRFSNTTSGGELPGNHWDMHGKDFIDVRIVCTVKGNSTPVVVFPPDFNHRCHVDVVVARMRAVGDIARDARHALAGWTFRRLNAERDIRPEPESVNVDLKGDGSGATNLIRKHLNSTSPYYPRELIQVDLLKGLQEVFGSDGNFTEIDARQHDESGPESNRGNWEIFLGESKKGLVPLSNSGSGLKTVILVLLNLIVFPKMHKGATTRIAYAFEELENNLHPALLRRLFKYIEHFAGTEGFRVFLTTHSNVALDVFGVSKRAQVIHVTHDGESATARTVAVHFDRLGVLSELGAKPSDLLQSNGIIWVEGPSDRIYLNRWIELFSDGQFQEGRDYQCAFYGGALLAKLQCTSPDQADEELINLLQVNPNIVLVCDSDRTARTGKRSLLKGRVLRLKAEVEKLPNGHIWITDAKEIENYIPGAVLGEIFDIKEVSDPDQFDRFFPSKTLSDAKTSFVKRKLRRKSIDKIELAIAAAKLMTKELLCSRFDLEPAIGIIINRIRDWNK